MVIEIMPNAVHLAALESRSEFLIISVIDNYLLRVNDFILKTVQDNEKLFLWFFEDNFIQLINVRKLNSLVMQKAKEGKIVLSPFFPLL